MEVSISAVIAQIINFWIMFWLFNKFAAKPLSNAIEDRKKLIDKLKKADEAYEEKLEIAKIESREIVQEGMERKNQLIAEGWMLWDQKRVSILNDAKYKADKILEAAEAKTKILEAEVEKNLSDWIKRVSLLVVKKLINKDPKLQQDYLANAIEELKN